MNLLLYLLVIFVKIILKTNPHISPLFFWSDRFIVEKHGVDVGGELRHRGEDEGDRGEDHHGHRGEGKRLVGRKRILKMEEKKI